MMKKKYIMLSMAASLLFACSDDSVVQDNLTDCSQTKLSLLAEIDQLNAVRADDSGFADGDRIGVYSVNYVNGQPGVLMATGNNSDNIGYVFDENTNAWNGERNILFESDNIPMDVIGYYPYAKDINDVNRYPISVAYNQTASSSGNGMSSYEASDFLWAKASGVTAASPNVILTFRHILSGVRVTLSEGEGFADDEWMSLSKSVMVSNTLRNGLVDLASGCVVAVGDKDGRGVAAKEDRTDFRAVVIPQTVVAGDEVLKITVGNQSYDFKRAVDMIYYPSRQHNFTIEVNKNVSTGDYQFSLLDESITQWESEALSHNGEAKEYLVIDLENGERLSSKVKQLRLDPEEIRNLKLTGQMLEEDFEYIRNNMTSLEAINIHDIDLSECRSLSGDNYWLPDYAFILLQSLKTCVLPAKVKIIGDYSFLGTSLTGSLTIPEGVVSIGWMAFSNANETGGLSTLPGNQVLSHNNLTGTLTLPSTLKSIGADAFNSCDFTGSLILPDGLEYIGENAFADCKRFSGDLHIPNSVTAIEGGALHGMTGLTGRIVFPEKLKEIKDRMFDGAKISMVEWPSDLQVIGYGAFQGVDFKSVVTLPESVINIGEWCFKESSIRQINFSKSLTVIPAMSFWLCRNLADTVSIPSKVELIGEEAFYGCDKLEALVLPASLLRIDSRAFSGCYSLNYIRCDAVEPPAIDESVFIGVEKDNFTLEVPEQSVDSYRNAPGWSEFKRISAYRNFVARPSKYNVLNKGGVKEIILNADSDWELTECPSWCHVDKTSGSKKTQITLAVDAMEKGSDMRDGKVVFNLKGDNQCQTHINVAQYDYSYDEDECLQLMKASKGNGIDLVIIGDGYDAVDISDGVYFNDMKKEIEYLFDIEPYRSYKEYFNVFTVFAMSEDSGVEALNAWRNTKFHVSMGDGCKRMTADYLTALDYCAEFVPQTVQRPNPRVGCILVSNSDMYEGVTYTGDSFCAVVTKSTDPYPNDARGVIQHEAGGHGIGWLGDEYVYHYENIRRCGCLCCQHVFGLEYDHSVGFSLNVSLNGNHKDVPWSHLIFHKDYGDIVDIYEGGYFHSRGVYRSEQNSCMNNNIPYYSTWSRQLIVERIMKLAGEKFDLDSFYAKDSRAMGSRFTSTTRSGSETSGIRQSNPPVRITGYTYGKKGGKR